MYMKLAPPLKRYHKHTSLDLLIKQINDYIKIQDYTIRRKRNKQSKERILTKIILCCDRDNKYHNKSHDH